MRRILRRLRVRLGLVLVGLAALAVPLGLWIDSSHRQARAVTYIRDQGGHISYRDEREPSTSWTSRLRLWLAGRLGDDSVRTVSSVILRRAENSPDLGPLADLHGLDGLELSGPGFGDDDLAIVVRFPRLTTLDLSDTRLTDSGLRRLAGLQRLEELNLTGTAIQGTELASLATLPRLRSLDLFATELRPDAVAQLARLRSLEHLSLGPGTSDAALESLGSLPRLKSLSLLNAPVTDLGVRRFLERRGPGAPILRDLGLHYTHVDPGVIPALQRDHPGTEIGMSY